MINKGLYTPYPVKIASITDEAPLVRKYGFKIDTEFMPGQFILASAFGAGEAPISISSSPTENGILEITVRNAGRVTGALHALKENNLIGLRGPYGNPFPIEKMKNRDLIFAAGGIGLAPLRSLLKYALDNRKDFGRIYLLYGAKDKRDMLFKDELKSWRKRRNLELLLTVDKPQKGWKGKTGVITTLFDDIDDDLKGYMAIVCGPPLMIKYTVQRLLEMGLDEEAVIVSLERHMKCGVGKCGHCYLVDKYVCIDGPVFSYGDLKRIKGVEPLLV